MNYNQILTDNYSKIKRLCHSYAFKYYIREDDLLSLVNYKLATINFEDGNVKFMTLANRVIRNAAYDMANEKYNKLSFTELESAYDIGYIPADNIDYKNQVVAIKRYVGAKFCKRQRIIFDMFTGGMTNREIRDSLSANKSNIHNAIKLIKYRIQANFTNLLAA